MRYGIASTARAKTSFVHELTSASGLQPGDEVSLNVRSAVVVRPD